MTIPLTGTGGLFTRQGKMIGGINESCTAVGTTTNSRVTAIQSEFETSDQSVISNLLSAQTAYEQSNYPWLTEMINEINSCAIQMAIDDGTGINPQTIQSALARLRSQMITAGASINQPTLGLSVVAGGSNVGNGTLIVSNIDAFDGTQNDYLFAETIYCNCTGTSYSNGGAAAGNEPFSVVAIQSNYGGSALINNWPQSDGINTSLTTINASKSGGLISDGGFESWTIGVTPSLVNWTKVTGTWGTTLTQQSGADVYTGAYSLKFTGTVGGENTEIAIQIPTANLQPNTVYGFCCWMIQDGSVAAGVCQFSLQSSSGGSIITDNAGNNNAVTKTMSLLTTSFAPVYGFFRTPAVLPSAIWFDIKMTTPLTSAHSVWIDQLQIAPAPNLLVGGVSNTRGGGPYALMFAGSTPFALNDNFTLTTTNSLGVGSFARSLDRTYGLRQMGFAYKIPSSGSPTISDTLIS